jgi:dynein light chain roadblock-type
MARKNTPRNRFNDPENVFQYSGLISHFCKRAKTTVKAMDPTNDLSYLRVCSVKYEMLIAPDVDYILIVIQNQPT